MVPQMLSNFYEFGQNFQFIVYNIIQEEIDFGLFYRNFYKRIINILNRSRICTHCNFRTEL
jgi:hypothetical protein